MGKNSVLSREELLAKIKILNECIWDNNVKEPQITEWLTNFNFVNCGTQDERELHALYLLSQFTYFGKRQLRELMKVLFRDLYKYPIIEEIRKANNNTTDPVLINREFRAALDKTKFLGVGNPSESGCHLLYYFRQESGLPKKLFIHSHEIFVREGTAVVGAPVTLTLRDPNIERYIFIDDFCGSGHQGVAYSKSIVEHIKNFDPKIQVCYFVLCGTSNGMKKIRIDTAFDVVECIFELDETFRCFSAESRYFPSPWKNEITKQFAEDLSIKTGKNLEPSAPLGYGGCQLILGFLHNTPDNTLPIFWHDGVGAIHWKPIFKRYPKIYS